MERVRYQSCPAAGYVSLRKVSRRRIAGFRRVVLVRFYWAAYSGLAVPSEWTLFGGHGPHKGRASTRCSSVFQPSFRGLLFIQASRTIRSDQYWLPRAPRARSRSKLGPKPRLSITRTVTHLTRIILPPLGSRDFLLRAENGLQKSARDIYFSKHFSFVSPASLHV